jgi:hypothetical protein
MIDANWTIGHTSTEPLAVFMYQRSYLMASYKNMNRVDFPNYYHIYYALFSDSSSSYLSIDVLFCIDILN